MGHRLVEHPRTGAVKVLLVLAVVAALAGCSERKGCCTCDFSGSGCSGNSYTKGQYSDEQCASICRSEVFHSQHGCPLVSSKTVECSAGEAPFFPDASA